MEHWIGRQGHLEFSFHLTSGSRMSLRWLLSLLSSSFLRHVTTNTLVQKLSDGQLKCCLYPALRNPLLNKYFTRPFQFSCSHLKFKVHEIIHCFTSLLTGLLKHRADDWRPGNICHKQGSLKILFLSTCTGKTCLSKYLGTV